MAANSDSIHQFGALRRIQRMFGDRDRRQAGRGAIRRGRRAAEAVPAEGRETGMGVDADDIAHLQDHWLSGRYWPNIDADTIRTRLGEGFRDALEDAEDGKRELIPVWVCSGDDNSSSDFRVDHVVTDSAVVVAIITPPPNR